MSEYTRWPNRYSYRHYLRNLTVHWHKRDRRIQEKRDRTDAIATGFIACLMLIAVVIILKGLGL